MESIVSKFALYTQFEFTDEIIYLIVEFGTIRTYMYVWMTSAEILVFKIVYMYNYSKI